MSEDWECSTLLFWMSGSRAELEIHSPCRSDLLVRDGVYFVQVRADAQHLDWDILAGIILIMPERQTVENTSHQAGKRHG
ncbi:hypothetical protein SODALDRAFT_364197 [Sodiomyces alkalinus F11]|uniref:Uncharacterized protein n=1 Tax=Sodiomyces alkalinus (strain CBS 110278 / VKM F-3762 / F11) TaxID=1314773 RepID=A0A3N2PJS9_SODAK|nr:hypothetical protein SODALDRAFT_364197 [Sodiomyces alkalinus F11]ROT34690.1 hypothetical protein SODALDRAFT_364197 [Sodiomyces alkalinus F11]